MGTKFCWGLMIQSASSYFEMLYVTIWIGSLATKEIAETLAEDVELL